MARKSTGKSKAKAKDKRKVAHGRAYVHATFNNTIVTVTDDKGDVLCWSSAGNVGFKGSRKGTPFAAQLAAERAARVAKEYSMETVDVYVSGPGGGRETAIRSLHANGLEVKSLRDVTPVPHNGCRPPKKRRV